MTAEAAIVMIAGAATAVVAGRQARSSKLALALAVASALVALTLLAAWVLGYLGCRNRPGGCPAGAGVARTVFVIAVLATVVLLAAAALRWAWRRSGLSRRRRRRPGAGRDALMVVVAAIFILLGVVMVVTGSADGGVQILLFGLALAIVPLAERLPDGSGPRLAHVDDGGARRPAVVAQAGRRRHLALMLGSALFAASGAFLLDDAVVAGVLVTAVFGTFAVIGLATVRRRPELALLPDGVRVRAGTNGTFVAWDDIADAGVTAHFGTAFLLLWVTRPDAVVRSGLGRRLAGLERGWFDAHAALPLTQLDLDPERLLDAVATYAADPQARAEIGTEASLRRLAGDAVRTPAGGFA